MKYIKLTFIAVLALLSFMEAMAQTSIDQVRNEPDKLFAYASGLYMRKFYDMALTEYRRFLEANPDDKHAPDALYYVAFCHRHLKKYNEMQEAVANFRKKYPKDSRGDELGVMAAENLLAQGKESQALEILSSLCSSNNKSFSEYANYNVARLLLKNGRQTEAETLLKPLADAALDEKMPYRAYAALEYARCLENKNQRGIALEYAKKVANFKGTEPAMAEEATFLVGEWCLKMNKKAEALEAFESCIANFPKGNYTKWCHIYRIHITFNKPDYNKALLLLADFREKYPNENNSEIDYWQAIALMECKRYNEALPFFQRLASDAKASQETKMSGHYFSIYCMLHSGNYAEAASQANDFAKAYPRTSMLGDVLIFGTQALLNTNRLDEAEAQCRKAMALFANTPDKFENALELLLTILEKNGKLQIAVNELLAQAEKADDASKSGIFLRAGRFAHRASNADVAKDAYNKAASSAKDKTARYSALISLLSLQLELSQYEEALKTIAVLKTLCSEDKLPELLFNEANVLICVGRNQQAQALLHEVIRKFGTSPSRRLKAQFMLATSLMVEGNDKGAIPLLDELLWKKHAEFPALVTYQFLEAASLTYERQGQPDKARATCEMIIVLKDATREQINWARLTIARSLLETRNDTQKAWQSLTALRVEGEKGAELDMGEVFSLLSEAEMLLGKSEMAMSFAEKALKLAGTGSRTSARAMFTLAYIYFNFEKNAETANRFATQCYILADDKEDSPRAMALSIEAFKSMGRQEQANEVLKELSQKYPLWLAAHPELRKEQQK